MFFLNLQINVFNIYAAEGDTITLEAGRHRYPFEFRLPSNAPSSFEGAYGSVRYTVEARIDRPWKFDHVIRSAFTVISIVDLNQEPTHLKVNTRICVAWWCSGRASE